MTTAEDWRYAPTLAPPARAFPETSRKALNWRLIVGLGLNIAIWATVLKAMS